MTAIPAGNADGGKRREARERWVLLYRLERWLEVPMLLLGGVWLVLLVLELTRGIGQGLERLSLAIWVAFLFEFALKLTLAPGKLAYLRKNWLTALSLVAPALRVLRFARLVRLLRAARTARGLRLVKVLGSLNRGMRALGKTMARRGLGYALLLTLMVTLVGAAGMNAFERVAPDGGLHDYWSALWWTAMIMTSLGSDYWPRTPEGRMLALVLSGYAVVVLSYTTAALASFFVGRDAERADGEVAGAEALAALQREVAGLREEIRAMGKKEG